MRIKTEKVIDLEEWDKVVIETYGRPYSFQQQDGCKNRGIERITVPDQAYDYENDSVLEIVNHPEMGVSFSAWLKRDPQEPIEDEGTRWLRFWWERNFYPDVQMVANDLHAKGILPDGEYLINIDW